MGINFGCSNGFVAQHILNCPQVGAAFYQMSSKRMAESMWTDAFLQTYLFCQFFNNFKDHITCKSAAAPVKENQIGAVLFHRLLISGGIQIKPNLFHCLTANRYQPLFVAFADNTYVSLFKMKVRKFQIYQFRHPQTTAIQGFDDCPVAMAHRLTQVDGTYQLINFDQTECIGQFSGKAWRVE